jgi:hypothetical protein
MLVPPYFLAAIPTETDPVSSAQATLLLWAVIGLFALFKAVDSASAIWARFRKTPPADQIYASKSELAALEGRMVAMEGTVSKRLDGINSTLENELRSVNRALGRLEGQIAARTGPPPSRPGQLPTD